MDLKGITWVGNVYQKFEALCLEVEDNMYEDTVKYVENQVQTVGASVKKFYSDVMQDILPLPESDPMKVPAMDLTMKNYTDSKVYKKPKLCYEEEGFKFDTKRTMYESNVVPEVVKHVGHRSYDIKDLIRSSSNVHPKKSLEVTRERIKATACPNSNVIFENKFKEQENEERIVEKIANETNGEDDVSVGLPSSNIRSSSSGGSAELNGMLAHNGEVSPQRHSPDGDIEQPEFAETGELITEFGNSDGWDTNPFEGNDEIEQATETSYEMDNLKLHESCVLVDVDGAKLGFVPHKEAKQKSYKKKLRDAIFSKKKSSRKQEYEQLTAQYEDIHAESSSAKFQPICATGSEKVLKTQDSCESEWELL